jgi:hypothetical protein
MLGVRLTLQAEAWWLFPILDMSCSPTQTRFPPLIPGEGVKEETKAVP